MYVGRASLDPATIGDEMARARRRLEKKRTKTTSKPTDDFYSGLLTLRGWPFANFTAEASSEWLLPIASANEVKFLKALGLSQARRDAPLASRALGR